eukprot:CAMPEP_0117513032 /NCGR_PEP_ID=MMETSP0784-20121206/29340_1 /TAXON_ID=39447 /ORGANISM="" /LENGTH=110 /DNA_ID=CAMNT_0005308775 /DNA_START=31 /DNA_END=363 /DNA_ORIENTATION=-
MASAQQGQKREGMPPPPPPPGGAAAMQAAPILSVPWPSRWRSGATRAWATSNPEKLRGLLCTSFAPLQWAGQQPGHGRRRFRKKKYDFDFSPTLCLFNGPVGNRGMGEVE